MPAIRTPANHYAPLAVGAPAPCRQLPVRLERMIHFVPPHNQKIRARLAELIGQVDVVLGNLEDAIPADAKAAARQGFIDMAEAHDFGQTGLWTRINALNSPWALDDILQIVPAIGAKLDVIMLPKVEGPWDIHYLDQLLAQLEAKHALPKPILIHAILETAQGVTNVEAIAGASPRMHGLSLGPADLAASRGMKTTRVGGGHPAYGILADASPDKGPRAFFQQDLWHYTLSRMVELRPSHQGVLRAVQGLLRQCRLRGSFASLPARLRRGLDAAPEPDRHRQARVQPRPTRSGLRQAHPRGHAGRHRGRHDRRQDAGRRHLEAGQGDPRPRQAGGGARSRAQGALRALGCFGTDELC
jgi:citrate lyase beta subunit